MKLRSRKLAWILCLVFMTAVLASAQDQAQAQERLGEFPPALTVDQIAPRVPAAGPGYTAVLLLSGLTGPWGIGVAPAGDKVFINDPWVRTLWAYDKGTQVFVLSTDTIIGAGRYKDGYFLGDDTGDICRLIMRDPSLKTLAGLGYSAQSYPAVTALEVDPANGDIYFVDYYSGNLYRLPKGGHTPMLIQSLSFGSYGIAVKGNLLYLTAAYEGNLYVMPKKGGSVKLFASGLNGPTDIIADAGGNLYIAEYYGGSIAAIKNGQTEVHKIATGFSEPFYIGVDAAGDVYFSDFGAGQLWKLDKTF